CSLYSSNSFSSRFSSSVILPSMLGGIPGGAYPSSFMFLYNSAFFNLSLLFINLSKINSLLRLPHSSSCSVSCIFFLNTFFNQFTQSTSFQLFLPTHLNQTHKAYV